MLDRRFGSNKHVANQTAQLEQSKTIPKNPGLLGHNLGDGVGNYTYHALDLYIGLPKQSKKKQQIVMDEIYEGLKKFEHFNKGNNSTAKPINSADNKRHFVEFRINDTLKRMGSGLAGGGDGINKNVYVEAFFDDKHRQVTAVTLGNHVVVGVRKWRVETWRRWRGGKWVDDIVVVTQAYERRLNLAIDFGFNFGGGKADMEQVWRTYLGNIGDATVKKHGGKSWLSPTEWATSSWMAWKTEVDKLLKRE